MFEGENRISTTMQQQLKNKLSKFILKTIREAG